MNHFKYGTNRRLIKALSIMLLALPLSSCSSEQGRILHRADSMMESRPDSAMTLLEGIDRTKLNKLELPYFALLYTQAQVKTDIPLDSDSLIRLAYDKYGNDFKGDRGLRSNFYTGEVYFNQHKNPEAMRYFLTVYEESKRNGNDYWHAKAAERISDLFFSRTTMMKLKSMQRRLLSSSILSADRRFIDIPWHSWPISFSTTGRKNKLISYWIAFKRWV